MVKFNMEKIYYLVIESYLEDTIISESSSSACLELDLDSTTNFDAPRKSFLVPAGLEK